MRLSQKEKEKEGRIRLKLAYMHPLILLIFNSTCTLFQLSYMTILIKGVVCLCLHWKNKMSHKDN